MAKQISPIKISVILTLTQKQLAEIIDEILDIGSEVTDYWFYMGEKIEPIKWIYHSSDSKENEDCDYPFNPGGALIFRKGEELTGREQPAYLLDMKAIRRGLLHMAQNFPDLLLSLLKKDYPNESLDQFIMSCLFLEPGEFPITEERKWHCDICYKERDAFIDASFRVTLKGRTGVMETCAKCHKELTRAKQIEMEYI